MFIVRNTKCVLAYERESKWAQYEIWLPIMWFSKELNEEIGINFLVPEEVKEKATGICSWLESEELLCLV